MAAFIIDFSLQLLAILLVALSVWGVDSRILGNESMSSGAVSIILVVAFVIYFGYFILYELKMNGQTMGKKIFGLRVIRENGQPIEFSQSLVRGLVRSSADMIYIGLFVILFHPMHKRLGDLAAGTIVICEKYGDFFEPTLATPEWPHFLPGPEEMTPEERKLIQDWLRRRDSMTDQGVHLGRRLMKYFEARKNQQNEGSESNESISD